MKPKFYSFWAINAPLELAKLCRELDEMKYFGFDGTVFHPRYYPNKPEYLGDKYLEILSEVILYAKSIDLEFWIYDENGYPSGTVGGKTLELYPELANTWLDLVEEKPSNCLTEFEINGKQRFLAQRTGHGVDYFNPQLAEIFLKLTYERYQTDLKPEAFDYLTTFFCDEPEFGLGHAYDSLSPLGAIPWTLSFPEIFNEKYGEDLIEKLPQLFFAEGDYQTTRIKFREFLTDQFINSFIQPLNNWCRSHSKTFTAHVKGEEHPLFQTAMNGSVHQVFQHVGLPGIDALERFPSGDFFPRQISSVVRQFGSGKTMVECFGGAGWGASPEDFENYLIWLGSHGINHFAVHLWQYELTTHAMNDWGPSIPKHLNWREVFPEILRKFKQEFIPRDNAKLLVVAPYRGIAAVYNPAELSETNIHNANYYPQTEAGRLNDELLELISNLQQSGIDYDVCDERTIEDFGLVENGGLKVGNCHYQQIILAKGTILQKKTKELIKQFFIKTPPKIRESIQTPKNLHHFRDGNWEITNLPANDFVLEAERIEDSKFKAVFESRIETEVECCFLDNPAEILVNGGKIDSTFKTVIGTNEIIFTCSLENDLIPFLSISGDFAVLSQTPFEMGANKTIRTKGGFILDSQKDIDPHNLTESGFSFCRNPVTISSDINLTLSSRKINLSTVNADCGRVRIDEFDRGWYWGAEWIIDLPEVLAAGLHKIEVELIPSTFNFFGPHHHLDGDLKVVSPIQFQYIKNFADRADAPENTRIDEWNFKPFGIGHKIEILTSDV